MFVLVEGGLPFGRLNFTYYSVPRRSNLRTPGLLNSSPYIFLSFARSHGTPALSTENTDTYAYQEKQTKGVAIERWRRLWEPGETP